MKQAYIKPAILIVESEMDSLMAGVSRIIKGGPVEQSAGEKSLPSEVGLSSKTQDPFSDHGQGTGGAGTRGKGFDEDVWEDD